MNGNLPLHLWLIPLLPLAGFLLNGLAGRRLPKIAVSAIALIFSALPFALAVKIAIEWRRLSLPIHETFQLLPQSLGVQGWISTSSFSAPFTVLLDQLTLIMLLVVTGVGFLIHVYSVGYMAGEEGYGRYFAYLNLFLFFMLTLVMADNFLLMFLGWEGVGLASYLLIGFYFARDSAARAGKKAFLFNRAGDFGFLLAMFLMIAHFGSLDFTKIFDSISRMPPFESGGFITAIALLLLLGATGKSAQIPLYVWLPDAMEGPTPVSALIHAATMVTAGVYMIVRAHVLFDRSPVALETVAALGGATALLAATMGLVQTDIKRVLAYSTISQLGYMFMACGAAAYSAAIFHLVNHAFFKGLLFLAAGAVIHSLHGEQDMRAMGGLRKTLPITFWTMTAAVFAICGIPPFSGFFSKDEILYQSFLSPTAGPFLWFIGLVTALLTSLYMFRLWYMTFFGKRRAAARHLPASSAHRVPSHAPAPHESPWIMLVPLILLAALSLGGGWIGIPHALGGDNRFERFLHPVIAGPHHSFEELSIEMNIEGVNAAAIASGLQPPARPEGSPGQERLFSALSVAMALLGWFFADLFYRRRPDLPGKAADHLQGLYNLFVHKYWVDEIYSGLIVAPVLVLSRLILSDGVDRGVIDGGGGAAAGAARGLGAIVQRVQSGDIRSYAGWVTIGGAAIVFLMFFGFRAHL